MELTRFVVRSTALSAADLVALVALRPDVPALGAILVHPHAAVARLGADAALGSVVGGAIWLVAAWLAAGLLAASATRLPGAGGRAAGRLSRALLPRAVRATLAGSAGLSLFLAPAAAFAQAAPPAGPAATVPSPAWPVDPSTTPPPAWPTTPASQPTDRSRAATPGSAPATPPPPRPTRPATPSHGAVTVHRGDSLWSIAARRLGADATPRRIATEWPRWFGANRAVVGDDPSLIHPGQVLHPPAGGAPDPEEAHR